MKLYTYGMLKALLNLLDEEQAADKLIFNAAYSSLEKYLGCDLEEKEYIEIHKVMEERVVLEEKNISNVKEVFDMDTKSEIGRYALDADGRTLFFLPRKSEEHTVFVRYTAGFTKGSFPDELKQILVKMFIVMKMNYLNSTSSAEYEEKDVFTGDVRNVLDKYRKKWV